VADIRDERPVLGLRAWADDRLSGITISLNWAAQIPNSSSEVTGTRAPRSPLAMRAAVRAAFVDRGEDAAGDEPGDDEGEDREEDAAREGAMRSCVSVSSIVASVR
jgi:hypothetical protein